MSTEFNKVHSRLLSHGNQGFNMKDLIGREVQVGNYICYALTAGRSANLAVYLVKEVTEDKIKAVKINESYGTGYYNYIVKTVDCKNAPSKDISRKYAKWSANLGGYIEMTEEEKYKVDNKTSTLSMPERIFILDNFSKELFNNETNNTEEINNA